MTRLGDPLNWSPACLVVHRWRAGTVPQSLFLEIILGSRWMTHLCDGFGMLYLLGWIGLLTLVVVGA